MLEGTFEDLVKPDNWETTADWQLFPDFVLTSEPARDEVNNGDVRVEVKQEIKEESESKEEPEAKEESEYKEEPEAKEESEYQEESKATRRPRRKKADASKSLKSQVKDLQAEIAELREEYDDLATTQDAPVQKRQKMNTVSATLSRRRKTLELLEKDLLIENLKEQNAALLAENTRLNEALALSQTNTLIDTELSITIPGTTMLLRYKSPLSSPVKPKVGIEQEPQRAIPLRWS